MKNYFAFYLEIGSDRDFDVLDIWMKYLRVVIHESEPPHAMTDFKIALFHEIFITHTDPNKSDFWPYAVFIKNKDGQRVRDYIANLISQCAERGDIWEAFHECASFPLDEAMWEWPEIEPGKIAAYKPKMTWRFDNNQVLAEGATMYDARIIVTVTWDYEGKEYSFIGYWYATSVAFICQRLDTIDPYYRRFVLLSHAFSIEHLRKQLQEELAYLITIHPTKREFCLKHHFEYEGLPNFYER